jgi:putative transposase
MIVRTVTCVAAPTPEQAKALKETMLAFNAACNYVSAVAWKERVFHRNPLHQLVYYAVRAEFHLPAGLTTLVTSRVLSAYHSSKVCQAKFHPLGAIPFDSRILRLLNLSTVSLGTLHGRIKVPLNIGGYQRNQLSNATLGETQLLFAPEKNRWSFAFSVKSETPPASDPSDFLGVDMGVKNVAVDSDGTFHAGGQIRGLRKRHLKLRRRLQKKGTKGAKRLLRKRRRKEARFQRHENHCISKQVVTAAKGTGRGVALEDLKGIRDRITVRKKQRPIFSAWAFHQLREFLAYKCADARIPLVAVDPRNTSRTCPNCGCVDKRNRPSQAVFRCVACQVSGHADVFAAREVARRAAESRPDCSTGSPLERVS